MSSDVTDITIVGGGPTGLFGAFYAGMRGMSCRVVDSLPELGGQLTALYPEKYIYDVGGFPKVLARDLATELIEQALQFEPEVVLDEEVLTVEDVDGYLELHAASRTYRTRSLLIAGGKGAFEPKKLSVPGYDEFLGCGVHHAVKDPSVYDGKRVMVVGGGDSALDWALLLKERCQRLVLIHRRDGFRAHERSILAMGAACEAGEMEFWPFYEVREITGGERVTGVTVFENRSDEERTLEVDAVLAFLGFKPDLGPVRDWDLELAKNRIVVDQLMRTNRQGIYGAGDIVDYEGKLDLIATGFAEAAIAVNNAARYVDPTARINPGHSTNLKIFRDK